MAATASVRARRKVRLVTEPPGYRVTSRWWGRWDLNPHEGEPQGILSPPRMPIPPHPHNWESLRPAINASTAPAYRFRLSRSYYVIIKGEGFCSGPILLLKTPNGVFHPLFVRCGFY